jgi:gluconate 5-dehydrogenase
MSLQQFDLAGKVAIVTGSGRGLGKVFAKGMAEAGARVVTCNLNTPHWNSA